MQLTMNFRNTVVLLLIVVVGWWWYRSQFAALSSSDVSKLIKSHRSAEPVSQTAIKLRIMTVYKSNRDYETVFRALDSASSTTQMLAVEILAEKVERRAVAKLLTMLNDPSRAEVVKETLANGLGLLSIQEALPRLVELTDKAEAPGVRAAAHNALQRLTGAGAQIKLGDSTRETWTLWLRTREGGGTR